MESIALITSDGVTPSGTRFVPPAKVKAVVVLPTAMGVKQDFYTPFAQFLTWLEHRIVAERPAVLEQKTA